MDPDACLLRILEAFRAQDRNEAIEAMEDLAEWLRRGGFMPRPGWVEGSRDV